MRWQQGRRTTRPEDQAYCLLGIFNVHMPLLYGEGKKAWLRLEKTIFEELQQPYQSRLTLDFFASNEVMSEPAGQRQHSRTSRPLALVRFSDIEGEVLCICGYQEDDGCMIACDLCMSWQHQLCFFPQYSDGNLPRAMQHCCMKCNPREVDTAAARTRQRTKRGGIFETSSDDDSDRGRDQPVRKRRRCAVFTNVTLTPSNSELEHKEPSEVSASPLQSGKIMDTVATKGTTPDIATGAAMYTWSLSPSESQYDSIDYPQLLVPLGHQQQQHQQQLEPVREKAELEFALQAGQTWRDWKPEDWFGNSSQSGPVPTTWTSYPAQSSIDTHQSFDLDEANRGLCPVVSCGRYVKDLKAHMLSHQNERPEKCPVSTCEYHTKGFARKYDKNRHTLTHYQGSLYCTFCSINKSFNRIDVFKRHLTSVHGVEQTPPNARRTSSIGNAKVQRPKDSIRSSPSTTCSVCERHFSEPQSLYDHLDDCVLRLIQMPQEEEHFTCQYADCASAGLNFARLADLQRHTRTVHDEDVELHSCTVPECSRKGASGFTRKDKLVEHMLKGTLYRRRSKIGLAWTLDSHQRRFP
ncbi:hypothetical protein LTR86_006278 [Recurvomyces mirabilis]|nr:hypothetical protein LTR86_006278 [Recurvomyces mirabilis]